jgi:hypothetical protein
MIADRALVPESLQNSAEAIEVAYLSAAPTQIN